MPSSGSTSITACGGVLLDPGGNNQYPNNCNGYITINPETPGCKVRISGNYHTESISWDWIEVYDGTSSSGTMLGSRVGGTGTLDVTSQTGSLTIWFRSDGSGQYDGFAFDITCVGSCDCGGPYGVTAAPGNGHVILSWTNPNAADISGYIIEYGPAGFTPGTGTTIYTTSTTYDITGLNNNTNYFFYVYYDCGNDHLVTSETATVVNATPSSIIDVNMPANGTTEVVMCSGHVYDSGGPSGNYSSSEDGSVIIYAENPWCQLSVSGSYYTESGYDRITILDGAGTGNTLVNAASGSGSINTTSSGSAITIQFHSDGSVQNSGFNLNINCTGSCTCGSHALTGVHLEADNMGYNLIWNEATGDPSIQHYIIEYGLTGFTPGTGTTVTTTGSPHHLTGLTAGSTYDFYVWADCGDDGSITTEIPAVVSYCVPDAVACIDFSDLNSPNIHGTYGTFYNPYATQGIVDNGPASSSSRHTLHTTSEADPRTGGGLMTIPPCELYSVRLGNWNTGAEAESISYDFAVDTTNADILLLKYAAVLEDPAHTSSEQPRFVFELLDQNGSQIDPACGYANFIANANLGWHNTNNVLWKDWTYVGFDVSAYHGQTVRVRLTTYDCEQSGHYGYAYFTLNCKKRTIVAETCGEMLTNTYTAPAGFNYAWYYEDQPNTILTTNQSCTVTITGGHSTLHCHVTFMGNSSCGFDLTTSLSSRYPLASCEPVRDSCTWSFDMHNTSTISFDGVNPSGTNEACETAHWDFGDGTTSDEYNPTHAFPGPGTYNVTLISGISNDECQDTTHVTIQLEGNYPAIQGPDAICQGDGATLTASGGITYLWTTGSDTIGQGTSLNLIPDSTTTYTLQSYASDGCLVSVNHEILVNPITDSTIVAEICEGESYTDNGFNVAATTPGTFTTQIVVPNANGCDSTVTLQLTVIPNDIFIHDTTICEGTDFDAFGFQYAAEELSIGLRHEEHLFANTHGCDSTEILNLTVAPVYDIQMTEDLCKGTLFNQYNFQLDPDTMELGTHVLVHSGTSISGCDSVFTLTVNVLPTNEIVFNDTVCQFDGYSLHGFSLDEAATSMTGDFDHVMALQNAYGCDSIVTLHLAITGNPIADFVANPERTLLSEGGGIQFLNITDMSGTYTGETFTWHWDFGDGSEENTNESNVEHTYDSWGNFLVTLSVESSNGCSSNASHYVYVEEDLIFPNVITPNGDNVNDVFAIKNLNPDLPNSLTVYNRWGKKVFEMENYKTYIKDDVLYNAESGFSGEDNSDGVYYYTFHYEGFVRAMDYHSSLTIIRKNGK